MTPDQTTRMGRMLAAGTVTVTVTSAKTGKHISVRIDCCRRTDRWERVPFAQASHVFINEEPQGTRIGTFYPRDGVWRPARGFVDPALDWAATHSLRAAMGDAAPQARFQESNQCGRCRRDLSDPVSIERGIGPECWGKLTGSRRADVIREAREHPARPRPDLERAHNGDVAPPPRERTPAEQEFGDWLTSEFPVTP